MWEIAEAMAVAYTERHPQILAQGANRARAAYQALQRMQARDDWIGLIVICAAWFFWLRAVGVHFRAHNLALLALDFMFPPFAITCGALRTFGLI
jgi:hypothetical protein